MLHARGQQQILFDFAMALFELNVGFAQTHFGTLLRGDVGESDDGEDSAIGIFHLLRGDHDGQAAAVALREEKLEEVVSVSLAALDFSDQRGTVFGRKQVGDFAADEFGGGNANHLLKMAIGVDDVAAIVVDDYALIERFQNADDTFQPVARNFSHRIASGIGDENRTSFRRFVNPGLRENHIIIQRCIEGSRARGDFRWLRHFRSTSSA